MYKAFIIEDDPMVAMIHQQYLESNPQFTIVGSCSDGRAGLSFLENNDVDLVVLDVYMPNLGGMEVLRTMRQTNIPASVIMVTAANDVATVTEAIRLGAVDYLIKPFTRKRFQEALNKFLTYQNAISSVTSFNQSSVDNILRPLESNPTAPTPKGIQEKTLNVLVSRLQQLEQKWQTGEEISQEVNLSSVTVRRYLNHLVKIGVADSEIDYETGGRPRILYRFNKTP